jgi:hypothetical protein
MERNGAQQCRHVASTTPPSPSETRREKSLVSQNAAGIGERHAMTERQNLQANLARSAAAPGRVATAALWDWPCIPQPWRDARPRARSPQGDGTPRQQIAVPGHATRHAAEARRPSRGSCHTWVLGLAMSRNLGPHPEFSLLSSPPPPVREASPSALSPDPEGGIKTRQPITQYCPTNSRSRSALAPISGPSNCLIDTSSTNCG